MSSDEAGELAAAGLEKRAKLHEDSAKRLRARGKNREADYQHGLAENYHEQARLTRQLAKLLSDIEDRKNGRIGK